MPTILSRIEAALSRAILFGARHWVFAVIAVGLLLYLPELGLRPFYREEGPRAVQALAILGGGSWWKLETAGLAYVAKPPLIPWLIALIAMVTGQVNEWAVRLPSVVAVVTTAVVCGATARILLDAQRKDLAALAAGLVFLCSPLLLQPARLGETDAVAVACTGIAFFAFVHARAGGRLGFAAWASVGAALAAAAFAKGPIPIAFAVIPIFATVILDRSLRQIASAVAAFALALVPLGVWVYLNLGGDAATDWTILTRIASARRMSSSDWLVSLIHLNQVPAWMLATCPWIGLATLYVWRTKDRGHADAGLIRALLLYAIPFTLVVLLWPDSRPRYGLPAIVPVAVLAGAAVAAFRDHWRAVLWVFVVGVVAVAGFQLSYVFTKDGRTMEQSVRRANAIALAGALKARPEGPILLVWEDLTTLPFNLIAYAGRPLRKVGLDAAPCRRDADTLLSETAPNAGFTPPAGWTTVGPVGATGLMLLSRDASPDICDRPTR
jgi:4-amino-4-deoxy-L-arabinose transferase-like glycosyltransferase